MMNEVDAERPPFLQVCMRRKEPGKDLESAMPSRG